MLVDLRAIMIWNQGGREFTLWFLPAVVLSNFLYLRARTQLPSLRAIFTDLAMTAVFPVAVPLSLLVWALLHSGYSGIWWTGLGHARRLTFRSTHIRLDLHCLPIRASAFLQTQS